MDFGFSFSSNISNPYNRVSPAYSPSPTSTASTPLAPLIPLTTSTSSSSTGAMYASSQWNDDPMEIDSDGFTDNLVLAVQGDGPACRQVGDGYCMGIVGIVEQDYDQAVAWYIKAGAKGDAEALNNLGVCFLSGLGIPKNLGQAQKCFEVSAELGNMHAQFNLGVMYYQGNGIDKDDEKALAWFHKAAEQGHAEALYRLAGIYFHGVNGVDEDKAVAIAFYKRAAEKNHPEALCKLGTIALRDNDYPTMFKYYEAAAKLGNAKALNGLGMCYLNEIGVEKDHKVAFQYFQAAAQKNNMNGMANLGVCFFEGEGIEVDYSQAVFWLEKCGEVPKAAYCLGLCYSDGKGVTANSVKAFKQFMIAADSGHVKAMSAVAECYRHGFGVEKDLERADYWCQRVNKNDVDDASESN